MRHPRMTRPRQNGDAPATRGASQDPGYPAAVKPQEVVKALAVLIACEQPHDADRIAADLPEFLNELDAVRAADGAMQLARSLDARRRATQVQPVIEQIVAQDFSPTIRHSAHT